ncbi:unnamed protein product [Durusdinium trenchii]|uniref:PPM-type phosphatase domain-containing protein n=1 Tax=Durusdinium trenchii TaxID=1381693 RepID=A0ABP0SST2_9DINO
MHKKLAASIVALRLFWAIQIFPTAVLPPTIQRRRPWVHCLYLDNGLKYHPRSVGISRLRWFPMPRRHQKAGSTRTRPWLCFLPGAPKTEMVAVVSSSSVFSMVTGGWAMRPGHLSNQPVHPSQNPGKALEGAFRNTDDDIFASMGADVEYSGSTGVVAMLDQGQRMLTMANVGDSRAVLGRLEGSTWCAIPLTTDLKPDLPEERERIELSGGTVCQFRDDEGVEAGPFRVWDGPACEKPGLAVSRSLGDGAARALGVTAIPVVTKHHLQPQDKFLIIATDGLWDSLDNQEVIRIVAKFQNMPSIALKALTEAVRRMEGDELSDDTTILLIRFA